MLMLGETLNLKELGFIQSTMTNNCQILVNYLNNKLKSSGGQYFSTAAVNKYI